MDLFLKNNKIEKVKNMPMCINHHVDCIVDHLPVCFKINEICIVLEESVNSERLT